MNAFKQNRCLFLCSYLLLAWLLVGVSGFAPVTQMMAQGNNASIMPLTPQVTAVSSTWISVWAPFTGDTNDNSYARFEAGPSPTGPWSLHCGNGQPGESEWRQCVLGNLTADSDYYVRVTAVDPDGVNGEVVQIIGPVHTAVSADNRAEVEAAVTAVKETYILVALPIGQDANRNSTLVVDISTSSNGPWLRRCGPEGNFAPKLCRLHGLTQGTAYWIQATVSDPDGTTGSATQVLGPITYTGANNLALNKTITTSPGWGCCSDPLELLDGRIQDDDWGHGFAWRGGTSGWGGGSPGWKDATIDFGEVLTVARVDTWNHELYDEVRDWRVEVSTDNVTYTEVFATTEPVCRTETLMLDVNWRIPRCAQRAIFPPVQARYIRYFFDDRTLFDGQHGWLQEIEVFGIINQAPVADAGGPYGTDEGTAVWLDASGSADPDGTITSYAWDLDDDGEYDDATGTAVTVNFSDNSIFPVGLLVTDDGGLTGTAVATITVNNVAPVVAAGEEQSVAIGSIIHLAPATFSDRGQDTHTATIDWGDGITEAGDIGAGTVNGSHLYAHNGRFEVEVCVTDDDGDTGCDGFTAVLFGPVYLPLVLKPPICFAPGAEVEPNNQPLEANGLLCGNGTYTGRFNDTDDYFALQAGSQPIDIRLSNYSGLDAQILLYAHPGGELVAQGYYPAYHLHYQGAPGRYFIRVYVPTANSAGYSLAVVFQ